MFGEENFDDPSRRDEPDEGSVVIDDGKRTLAVAHGLPRGDLLVNPGEDHRRIPVHQLSNGDGGRGGEHVFETRQPDEPVVIDHRNVGCRLEAFPDQAIADLAGRHQRSCCGHTAVRRRWPRSAAPA